MRKRGGRESNLHVNVRWAVPKVLGKSHSERMDGRTGQNQQQQ